MDCLPVMDPGDRGPGLSKEMQSFIQQQIAAAFKSPTACGSSTTSGGAVSNSMPGLQVSTPLCKNLRLAESFEGELLAQLHPTSEGCRTLHRPAKKKKRSLNLYAVRVGARPGIYKDYRMAEQASKGGTYRPLATRKDAQDYMEDRLNIFNGKYYAVAYGRAPGIYDYWEHILEKIHPYNATHPYLVMAFTSVQAAWEWINETREGHPIPSNFSSAYGYSPHPPSGTDTLSSSMQRGSMGRSPAILNPIDRPLSSWGNAGQTSHLPSQPSFPQSECEPSSTASAKRNRSTTDHDDIQTQIDEITGFAPPVESPCKRSRRAYDPICSSENSTPNLPRNVDSAPLPALRAYQADATLPPGTANSSDPEHVVENEDEAFLSIDSFPKRSTNSSSTRVEREVEPEVIDLSYLSNSESDHETDAEDDRSSETGPLFSDDTVPSTIASSSSPKHPRVKPQQGNVSDVPVPSSKTSSSPTPNGGGELPSQQSLFGWLKSDRKKPKPKTKPKTKLASLPTGEKRKPGRPKKAPQEDEPPKKRGPGRPRKVVTRSAPAMAQTNTPATASDV